MEITEDLRKYLLNMGLSWGFPASIVEDCVQDSLIKINKHMGRYDSKRGKFITWAGVILYRTMLDIVKRKRPVIDYDISDFGDHGLSPQSANQVKTQTEIDHVMYYFNRLETRYKQPMFLRMSGYSYDEIKQIMGWPMGRVKSSIHRGRNELLKMIEN